MLLEIDNSELNQQLFNYQRKRKPCQRIIENNFCKCTLLFFCISGLNALSFYMGYYYNEHYSYVFHNKTNLFK